MNLPNNPARLGIYLQGTHRPPHYPANPDARHPCLSTPGDVFGKPHIRATHLFQLHAAVIVLLHNIAKSLARPRVKRQYLGAAASHAPRSVRVGATVVRCGEM